jgi:nuclear pore complex protein Nup85
MIADTGERSSESNSFKLDMCESISQLHSTNRTIKSSLFGSELAFFVTARKVQENNQTVTFPEDQVIKIVKIQVIPKARRKFIETQAKVFETKAKVAVQSKEYLQNILSHIRETTGEEASFFSALHGIWNLLQITLLDQSKTPCLDKLSEWMRLNLAKQLTLDFETVTKAHQPTSHVKFWPLIYTCVMRGYFEPAQKLLSFLKELNLPSNIIDSFNALTFEYPKFDEFQTVQGFKDAFYKWNQEALYQMKNIKNMPLNHHLDNFEIIFGILSGDETTIIKTAKSWPDSVLALLHFEFPMHTVDTLNELTELLHENFDRNNLVDQIHLSLLNQDIGKTIQLCAQFDIWLVTHLVDLLDRQGMLETVEFNQLGLDVGLTESYLLNYAEYLFSEPDLWEISLLYLQHCESLGKSAMELVVPRIPLSSPQMTQKILKYCDKNQLKSTKQTILSSLARVEYSIGNYGKSIDYYLQADDHYNVSVIVDQLLLKFIETGDRNYEKVLDSISDDQLHKSQPLSFLVRYKDFQNYYNRKQFKLAADLVVLLLTSSLAPKIFWRTLLWDALPLLEGQVMVFSVDQIMDMMRCIEICNQEKMIVGFREGGPGGKEEDFVILKLALARSLAAATITEF